MRQEYDSLLASA